MSTTLTQLSDTQLDEVTGGHLSFTQLNFANISQSSRQTSVFSLVALQTNDQEAEIQQSNHA